MLEIVFFKVFFLVSVVCCLTCANNAFNRKAFEMSIFPPLPVAVYNTTNTLCKEHSDMIVDSLKNYTLWANEMWDSTAKSSSGVLSGSIFQMGHFEQCLATKAPFQTQYCLATIIINVSKPKKIRDNLSLYFNPYDTVFERLFKYDDASQQSRNIIKMGWCIPASCSILDLEHFLLQYLNNNENPVDTKNITYGVKFAQEFCQTALELQYFNNVDISFCALAVLLIMMVIIATISDYKNRLTLDKKPVKSSFSSNILKTFSARQNFNELSKSDDSNPALSIFYGMRTISIFAIIVDHRFGTFISSAILNFNYVELQYRSAIACLLFHGDLFVDSFFILSGLLVVYNLLNQFDKTYTNPGFILLLRYVRLTPVYSFVIFYYATIFNHSGEGPLWKVIAGADSKDCRTNWWTNLLYINNYVNTDHMCMTHSWYMPCDFHYFIMAIGLCLLIKKQQRTGLIVLLITTIISILIPFILTIVYQRPALLYFYPEFLTGPKVHTDFKLTYSKSHTRASPYFIGMFAGYVYYKLKGTNKHICKAKSYLIVVISLVLISLSIFSGMVFYNPYHKYNSIESAAYAALHRPAWALGTVGLLYVASFGHGSFLKITLSWTPFIPLSKLVYGAYLTHMQFQLRSAAKFMNPRQITYFDVISLGFSDIVWAFITALVLFLLIEAPFRKIFRELMTPTKENKPKVTTEPSTAAENMINNNINYQDSRL